MEDAQESDFRYGALRTLLARRLWKELWIAIHHFFRKNLLYKMIPEPRSCVVTARRYKRISKRDRFGVGDFLLALDEENGTFRHI